MVVILSWPQYVKPTSGDVEPSRPENVDHQKPKTNKAQ